MYTKTFSFITFITLLIFSSCGTDNSVNPSTNCNGLVGTLEYDHGMDALVPYATGGEPPYEYYWKTAGVTDLDGNYFEPLPGDYNVKVVDNNLCEFDIHYHLNGFKIGYNSIEIDDEHTYFELDDVVLENYSSGYISLGTQQSVAEGTARIILKNTREIKFEHQSTLTSDDLKTKWVVRLEFDDDSFYTSSGADFPYLSDYGTIDIDYVTDDGESGEGIDAISIVFKDVQVKHGGWENEETRSISGNITVSWI